MGSQVPKIRSMDLTKGPLLSSLFLWEQKISRMCTSLLQSPSCSLCHLCALQGATFGGKAR